MRKLKTECEDCLVIDDVLFRIKVPKDKSIEPSLLFVILETHVPTIPYQYHHSLLAGHQGVTRMYLTALTHITRIHHDFDVANLLRYRDDNTLPHIVHFCGKIQETLCKSREAVLQNQGGDCFFYSYATVVLILSNKCY